MAGGSLKLFIGAGVLTILLFIVLQYFGVFFESKREDTVTENMDQVLADFEDIEASYYLMDYLSYRNDSCDAILNQLNYQESKLWDLDKKIGDYRDAVRDFGGEDFYLKEKRRLNLREVIYLSMLERVRQECNNNRTVILYYYGNCKSDPACGEQGFVLSYFNNFISNQTTILSFDGDRDIPAVNTLMKAYNVTQYPCLVIEGHTHCGLKNREELKTLLCTYSPYLSIC